MSTKYLLYSLENLELMSQNNHNLNDHDDFH